MDKSKSTLYITLIICAAVVIISAMACVFAGIYWNSDKKDNIDSQSQNAVLDDAQHQYEVVAGGADMKDKPEDSAATIIALEGGSTVDFISVANGDYYMVKQEDSSGYVLKSRLKDKGSAVVISSQTSQNNSNVNAQYDMYVVNCKENVSLRTSPAMSASVIAAIPLGAKVGFVNEAENGYSYVTYNGNVGYVITSYLSQSSAPVDSTVKYTMYVVNCNENITLRCKPSTQAGGIMTIPLGASVGYISDENAEFYKINYNGIVGYSLKQYLSVQPASSAVSAATDVKYKMRVVNCKEWISLRESPSTSSARIVQIPLGAEVGFIENAGNGFYRITYNGKAGYALAEYLTDGAEIERGAPLSADGNQLTVVNCQEWVSLRATPSTSAERLATVNLGESVTYVADAPNGFTQVSYGGKTGYILTQYLAR